MSLEALAGAVIMGTDPVDPDTDKDGARYETQAVLLFSLTASQATVRSFQAGKFETAQQKFMNSTS